MKTTLFDKLNLRPQERRLVVIVSLVVFILLNMWFVFPFFGEWGKVQNDLGKDSSTLDRYRKEIARKAQYDRKQRDLEQTGSEMLNSENDFMRIITSQAASAGVYLTDQRALAASGIGTRTNQFFQEQSISVQLNSGGKEIVDFLVGIAAQNMMIRVREMSLRPEPPQNPTKLVGSIVFAGNYARPQTNANTRAARTAAVAPTAGAATKKATNLPSKTPVSGKAATNSPPKTAGNPKAEKKK
jgi:Tfp pilus assembly protein PilO